MNKRYNKNDIATSATASSLGSVGTREEKYLQPVPFDSISGCTCRHALHRKKRRHR